MGGMHWAVHEAELSERVLVVAAYDLNDTANRTYRHNFPSTAVHAVRHFPSRRAPYSA